MKSYRDSSPIKEISVIYLLSSYSKGLLSSQINKKHHESITNVLDFMSSETTQFVWGTDQNFIRYSFKGLVQPKILWSYKNTFCAQRKQK